MAPRRKQIATTVSSKTQEKRKSQRVVDKMIHGTNKSDKIAQKKKSRPQLNDRKRRSDENGNIGNDTGVITGEGKLVALFLIAMTRDVSIDPKKTQKPMSVNTSNDEDPDQHELSTSNSCSSNTSCEEKNINASRSSQFEIDDDDDTNEFEAMFMSKAHLLKAKSDYNPTSLPRSQCQNR